MNRLAERPAAATLQDLENRFRLEVLTWCEDAFVLRHGKRELVASDLFSSGEVFVQNASSLVPVLALDAEPGQAILDVCAAPGGKAIRIASVLDGDCELWVNDALRLPKLERVLDTYRVRPIAATRHPGQYIDRFVDRTFDRVLLDAQCGGEGRIDLRRRHALRYWSTKRITADSRLQRRMIVPAFRLLRPGGRLVYATCTFAPEENEAVVDHLLRRCPEARVEPIPLDLPDARPGLVRWRERTFDTSLRQARRIVPTSTMEGFFVCAISKG